jgi:phosphoglycolate phosphatase-like HAD superfamily hydrolase
MRFDGKTDIAILREALEPEGIDADEIRHRISDWEAGFVALTHRLTSEAPLFACCPGTERLLQRLDGDERFELSVLTGNLERMAGVKLAAVGLDRHFRLRGAYGSDHEDRNELPAIAAARIAEQTGRERPPGEYVIIGDTPRDIEAAQSFGMRCVGVATGHYSLDALAAHEPDVLLPDLSETDLVIETLLRE